MAVIINEFEVIVDTPRAEGVSRAEEPAPPSSDLAESPQLTPFDLELIERHRERRLTRVRAH